MQIFHRRNQHLSADKVFGFVGDCFWHQLVRFYRRIGFKIVHEVTGSFGDMPHMLVWGGVGTRMDADIEELLTKWCSRFKSQ